MWSKFYPVCFLMFTTLPALQYLQFLRVMPHVNVTWVYGAGLFLLLLKLGAEWLGGEHRQVRRSALWACGVLSLLVAQQLVWWLDFLRVGAGGVFLDNFALTGFLPLVLLLTGLGAARAQPPSRVYLLSLAVYVVAVVLGVWANYQETGLTVIKFVNYLTGERFNYLHLSDTFALVAILLLTRLRGSPFPYFLMFTLSVAVLVATFSRTSLLLFMLVFALQVLSSRTLRVIGVAVVSVLTGLAVLFFSSLQQSENYQRVSSLLSSPETDSSFVGRSDIAASRLADLRDHLWTGQYMAEWWAYGERGGYLHNLLSYLDSYGALTFALLLLLLLRVTLETRRSPAEVRMTFLYALMAVLFSRSYVWPYLWLAVGLVVGSRPVAPSAAESHGEERHPRLRKGIA